MTGARAQKEALKGKRVRRRAWHPDSYVCTFKGFVVRHRTRGLPERSFFDFTPEMTAARDWEVA